MKRSVLAAMSSVLMLSACGSEKVNLVCDSSDGQNYRVIFAADLNNGAVSTYRVKNLSNGSSSNAIHGIEEDITEKSFSETVVSIVTYKYVAPKKRSNFGLKIDRSNLTFDFFSIVLDEVNGGRIPGLTIFTSGSCKKAESI